MQPIGPLMIEHRLIERCVRQLVALVETIDREQRLDPARAEACIEFIRVYADGCHHGKEEDILFRELARKPLPAALSAMMEELLDDHVHGRQVTGRLAEAVRRYAGGSQDALGDARRELAELAAFYPRHIEKEDRQFFKPCMTYLSPEERDAMLAEFQEFDRSLIHERYRLAVEKLEANGA